MGSIHKLTVSNIKKKAPGKHSDGGGLWLHKRRDGGAQWFLHITVHGRRREMGLGPLSQVTLKEARAKAAAGRVIVQSGLDPIKERDAAKDIHLLRDIAEDAFESRKAELKGDGKAGRWMSPLQLHVLPKLGKIPVADIDQRDIRDTLAPIWHTKADTARKAMNRLGICLKHAAALGLTVDLQAVEKAKALLGKTRHKPKNVPALSWQEVPSFYQELSEGTVAQLALRLLILTAVRSKPLRFARTDQIVNGVWTIPGDSMKGRRDLTDDFRVPLSVEALAVIKEASKFERDKHLFPSVRKGVISDATMSCNRRSSSGRAFFVPDTFSEKMRSTPIASRAEVWASRCCSSVETRA